MGRRDQNEAGQHCTPLNRLPTNSNIECSFTFGVITTTQKVGFITLNFSQHHRTITVRTKPIGNLTNNFINSIFQIVSPIFSSIDSAD